MNPEKNFKDVQLLMDITDNLRRAQMAEEVRLGDALDENKLREVVKKMYADQDRMIDEDLIEKGIQLLKEKRFEYKAPTPSLSLRLAELYILRQKWLPYLYKASAGTVAAALLFVTGSAVFSTVQFNSWNKQAVASIGQETGVRQQLNTAQQKMVPYEQDAALKTMLTSSEASVQTIEQTLAKLPALPKAEKDAKAFFFADKEKAKNTVTVRNRQLAELAVPMGIINEQISSLNTYKKAVKDASVFEATTPDYLASYRNSQRQLFNAAMARKEGAKMSSIVSHYSQVLDQAKVRDNLAELVQSYSEKIQALLNPSLSQAVDALAAGGLATATQLNNKVNASIEQIGSTYELRIVSRPGEKSGFFRHPDDGRRNEKDGSGIHYLVVEALDPAGNLVPIQFNDAETEQPVKKTKFAVAVSEKSYNEVVADKTDDGIINNNILAKKVAGELDPVYNFDMRPGYISQW